MLDNLPNNLNFSPENNDFVLTLLPGALKLLENDFITSGIDIQLSNKTFNNLIELREIISQHIVQTGGPASEKFYHLLYRVDIPESKIKSLLSSADELPFEMKVAELIIIRELQKEFYRKHFGK